MSSEFSCQSCGKTTHLKLKRAVGTDIDVSIMARIGRKPFVGPTFVKGSKYLHGKVTAIMINLCAKLEPIYFFFRQAVL